MKTEVFGLPSAFPVANIVQLSTALKDSLQREGLTDNIRLRLLLLDAGLATYKNGEFMVPEPHSRIVEEWIVFAQLIAEKYLLLSEVKGDWLRSVPESNNSSEELFLDQTIFLFVSTNVAC